MTFDQAFDPFRALGQAWRLIQRAPVALLVGGVLLVVLDGGGGFGMQLQDGGGGLESVLAGAIFCGACVLGLAVFAFTALVRVGFPRCVRRAAVEGTEDVGDLFRGTDRWLAMVLTLLLQVAVLIAVAIPGGIVTGVFAWLGKAIGGDELAVAAAVLTLVFYLPFLAYVGLGIALAPYAVALEGSDPIASLERSWNLVAGHRLRLLLYWLATTVAALLGLLVCCVGVLFTGTLSRIAWIESYLRLTTPQGDQDRWWLERGDPPGGPPPGRGDGGDPRGGAPTAPPPDAPPGHPDHPGYPGSSGPAGRPPLGGGPAGPPVA